MTETPTYSQYPVCEKCGAMNHGNANCAVCRSHWPGGDPLPRWRETPTAKRMRKKGIPEPF